MVMEVRVYTHVHVHCVLDIRMHANEDEPLTETFIGYTDYVLNGILTKTIVQLNDSITCIFFYFQTMMLACR